MFLDFGNNQQPLSFGQATGGFGGFGGGGGQFNFGFNPSNLEDTFNQSPLSFGAGGDEQGIFGQLGGFQGLGAIAQGIASLGSAFGAFKGLGLAKDQLKFTKNAFNTNLRDSRKAFNLGLEDRIRSRVHTEGRPQSDVQSFLDKHSL